MKGILDVVLVASGSEVGTIHDVAALLRKENGLKVQVVSAISDGIFRLQSKAYQDQLIPANVPVYGVTAGLPATLENLVGPNGAVFGLDHFGYSAPAKVLDEKFGFSAEFLKKKVLDFLK